MQLRRNSLEFILPHLGAGGGLHAGEGQTEMDVLGDLLVAVGRHGRWLRGPDEDTPEKRGRRLPRRPPGWLWQTGPLSAPQSPATDRHCGAKARSRRISGLGTWMPITSDRKSELWLGFTRKDGEFELDMCLRHLCDIQVRDQRQMNISSSARDGIWAGGSQSEVIA